MALFDLLRRQRPALFVRAGFKLRERFHLGVDLRRTPLQSEIKAVVVLFEQFAVIIVDPLLRQRAIGETGHKGVVDVARQGKAAASDKPAVLVVLVAGCLSCVVETADSQVVVVPVSERLVQDAALRNRGQQRTVIGEIQALCSPHNRRRVAAAVVGVVCCVFRSIHLRDPSAAVGRPDAFSARLRDLRDPSLLVVGVRRHLAHRRGIRRPLVHAVVVKAMLGRRRRGKHFHVAVGVIGEVRRMAVGVDDLRASAQGVIPVARRAVVRIGDGGKVALVIISIGRRTVALRDARQPSFAVIGVAQRQQVTRLRRAQQAVGRVEGLDGFDAFCRDRRLGRHRIIPLARHGRPVARRGADDFADAVAVHRVVGAIFCILGKAARLRLRR